MSTQLIENDAANSILRKHTRTHARRHTHKHPHTHTYTHTVSLSLSLSLTHTHTHTHTHCKVETAYMINTFDVPLQLCSRWALIFLRIEQGLKKTLEHVLIFCSVALFLHVCHGSFMRNVPRYKWQEKLSICAPCSIIFLVQMGHDSFIRNVTQWPKVRQKRYSAHEQNLPPRIECVFCKHGIDELLLLWMSHTSCHG